MGSLNSQQNLQNRDSRVQIVVLLTNLDDDRNLHSMPIDLPTVAAVADIVLAGITMLNRGGGGGSGPGAG